jgi:BirA family transcriptional regulator, biotin operon repressor / biotin---[acetyl-CoA-carboxylase] ligase
MDAFHPFDLGDPARRVGRRLEYHERIDSTNDRVRELLGAGEDGIVVVADMQTAGRGRRGRSWHSPPGLNLMLSAGLRVGLPAGAAWRLGASTALAVRKASMPYADLQVKWPNDLVTRDGAKVAGLLLETAMTNERVVEAIIGIGINVNWRRADMPADIADRATSLRDLTGTEVDRTALLRRLLESLDAEVLGLERGESPLARLRAASWLDGRPVRVSVAESDVEGVVSGIGDDGALVVETARGPREVSYGEVVAVALPA